MVLSVCSMSLQPPNSMLPHAASKLLTRIRVEAGFVTELASVRQISIRNAERLRCNRGQATQKHDERTGDAINNSLSDSDQIAEVIRASKPGDTTFSWCSRRPLASISTTRTRREDALETVRTPAPEFEMTSQDVKFLKSLRISVDEAIALPQGVRASPSRSKYVC